MTKEELEKFLLANGIGDSKLPDMHEYKYSLIHKICLELGWSLLNSENLKVLIPIVVAEPVLEDKFCFAVDDLYKMILALKEEPSALTQDTFSALCKLFSENVSRFDIWDVTKCFKAMKQKDWLTPNNIAALLTNIGAVAEDQRGWCLSKITYCLGESWVTKEYLDLMLKNRAGIEVVYNISSLEPKKLTIDNCKALIDCFPFSQEAISYASFKDRLLQGCENKLNLLFSLSKGDNVVMDDYRFTMQEVTNKAIILKHLANIYFKLSDIMKQPEHQADPRKVLHLVAVILNALPLERYPSQSADITELLALGREAEGHSSPVWQAIGLSILLLAAAISFACLGVGVVTAVIGLGLFAYGSRRAGLSKDIMSLAAEVSPVASTH